MIETGYLDPGGRLHWCPSWEHLETAEKLCEEFNFSRGQGGIEAEQALFNEGWICIQANGMQSFLPNSPFMSVTKAQKEWLENNYENMNNGQRAYTDLLLDGPNKEL